MSYVELSSSAGAAFGRACLYGSIFILVIWLICRVVPKLSDSARCGLWWLASFKLILGLVLSASVAIPLLPAHQVAQSNASIAVNTPMSGIAAHRSGRRQQSHSSVDPAIASTAAPIETGAVQEHPVSWPTPLEALFGVWALIVMFRLGYLCRSLIVLKQYVARSVPLEDPALLSVAEDVTRAFGITKMPRLRVSDTVTDPLLCGLFHKVILFSASDIASLSPEEFRLVFAHECAHLRRGDLWLSLVPATMQTLYCFFPPACLVCSEFEATREAACDIAALNTIRAEPIMYGRLLLKLSSRPERLDPLSLAGALGVSSHLRLLRRRISMLQFSHPNSGRRALAGTLLVSACGLVGLIPWQIVSARADGGLRTARSQPQSLSGSDANDPSSGEALAKPKNLAFTGGMSGWRKTESMDDQPLVTGDSEFNTKIEPNGKSSGMPALSLTCIVTSPKHDAVVSQRVRSDEFKGKRVRFSALVKTTDAKAAAGIWLREDASNGQRAWNAFDDPILGTTEWKRYDYVLDVLPTSTILDFGVMLEGRGNVEVTDFKFEVVDPSIAVSKPHFDSMIPEKPVNLDFKSGITGWNESTQDGDEAYFASGVDPNTKRSGVPAPYLACNSDKKGVYGVLTQWIDATPYRGKRIRFSGYIKTASIHEYAGLMWCLNSGTDITCYDMRKHALKGDHSWTHVEYVADVPEDRTTFTIGINLQGRGTVWVDDLKFEVVGKDVALTPAYFTPPTESGGPQNLNFAQGLGHWSRTANGDNSPNPNYEVGLDRSVTHAGSPAAFLKASVPEPLGYGALRQDVSAAKFRGKRILFTGYLKSKGIEKYTGMLLAVVSPSGTPMWSMTKRPLIGTTDWTRCEYVVDIPADAEVLMFGASIQGRGAVYATDFKFEVVGKDVPVTEPDSKL